MTVKAQHAFSHHCERPFETIPRGPDDLFDGDVNLGGQAPAQSEEENAGVRACAGKDKSAEILVFRNHDLPLGVSEIQDPLVGSSSSDETRAEVLVDQESHAERFSGRGINSSRPARSAA